METKYCLPIIQSKTSQVINLITDNQSGYDYFEIWLDYIKDLNLDFIDSLKKKYGEKLIFLFRRQNLEAPKMVFQERVKIINNLSNSSCLLDLDLFSQNRELEYINKFNKKIKLILSYHNYQETPVNKKLEEIFAVMIKQNPDIYKISTFCKTDQDSLRLIDLLIQLKEKDLHCIVLGMGVKGVITRIAGAILGSEINFAPINTENKSAPGQLTKKRLEKILKEIKVCYFVADPVEHSMSPQMHEAGYRALGIENKFLFLRRKVKAKDLKKFIESLRKNHNFRGASISIPHKIKVMKYLDSIDETAKKIGAVNTIIKEGQKLKGYNTDWMGILTPLKQVTRNLNNKTAAIIGAGGAARAAVYALVSQGTKVTIFNRDIKKAQNLAEEFKCGYDSLRNINKISQFEIVIHATKIGINPNDTPIIAEKLISANQIIFDVVYSKDYPLTKFIKQADGKKAKTISGIEMLLYQGIEQFKLLTGREISVEVMRKAVL